MMSFDHVIEMECRINSDVQLNKFGTVMVRTSQRLRTKIFYKIISHRPCGLNYFSTNEYYLVIHSL